MSGQYVISNVAKCMCAAFQPIQYNTIQYKTCNAPYVTRMLFLGAKCLNSISYRRAS